MNVDDAAMARMQKSRKQARDKDERWTGIKSSRKSPPREVLDTMPDAVILQTARFEQSGQEMYPTVLGASAIKEEQEDSATAAGSKAMPSRPLRIGSTLGKGETKAPAIVVGADRPAANNADHVEKCVDQEFDFASVGQFVYSDSPVDRYHKEKKIGPYKFNLLPADRGSMRQEQRELIVFEDFRREISSIQG